MSKVISKDGTPISYERTGNGPPVILVDGALCSSKFGPMPKLAPLLARHFTVFAYDRRGRGESGDRQPYSREREIEDLAAILQEAGGSAYVLGLSSGAALALEAAASGLNIKKVAAYEPPYVVDSATKQAEADHQAQLQRLIAEDKRGEAVKYFMREMVGVPAPFVVIMQLMPKTWRKLKEVAHTLPYDAAIMGNWSPPTARFASIRVPVIAMHGEKTDKRLKNATDAIAKAVPQSQRHVLPGQSHNVKPEVLSSALVQLFNA
jgi:pimeloyl-ACP methyl ester carboxylesterase